MNYSEITEIVLQVSGLKSYSESKKQDVLYSRYAIIVLLYEEGLTYHQIAVLLKKNRTTIYWNLKVIDGLLICNREFKRLYLACIAKIAEREDQQCA